MNEPRAPQPNQADITEEGLLKAAHRALTILRPQLLEDIGLPDFSALDEDVEACNLDPEVCDACQ